MQTFSTRPPARVVAMTRALSADPTPAQVPTVAATEPVKIEIEIEIDEPDAVEQADPAPAVNPFAGLMVDRSAVPAANDAEADPDAAVQPGKRERRKTGDAGDDVAERGVDANARLRRVVGPRLVRARLLSGLSQGDVARLLHFKNQTQVALWESSRRLITMPDLVRVAEVLGVSESYLLGTSHEPERDPAMALRHACLRGVREMLTTVASITVDEVARHARLVGPHAGTVRGLIDSGHDLLEVLNSFIRQNSGAFANQRGSASVVRLSAEFEAALSDARKRIALHNALDADLRCALAELPDADAALQVDAA